MRRWISAVCILFAVVVCLGKEDTLGPADFALGDGKPKTSVEEYYENHSILKVYDGVDKNGNAIWRDVEPNDLNKEVYVISHGLNDIYNSGWIGKSAKAIKAKNSKAVIISVNWDHYSGTESNIKDSNFGASSWINSVTPVLAGELSKFKNIKSFVGHSYGAHLLAATAVTMKDNLVNNKISFVALDPAEETLTFTGEKDGKPTWMWSKDKKSKNWELPSNVESEVYKSSGFLGSEERLGKYNYFLAAESSITPRGVLGDLDPSNKKMDYSDLSEKEKEKGLTNHSLAPAWFAEFITKQEMGGYEDDSLIGGWFKSDTDKYRENRSSGYWDGIVNANTSPTDPRLEYAARGKKESFTEWQDLCNAEAQYLLYQDLYGNKKEDKSNWQGTVLKTDKYDNYKRYHDKGPEGPTDNNSKTTTSNNGNTNANTGNVNTTSTTKQNSNVSQNSSTTQNSSTSTTGGGQDGKRQNTTSSTTSKTPQTQTTTTSSTPQTQTTTTSSTTTTSTTGDQNSSKDQSGIAEWRKVAYRILMHKDMPDNTNTQTSNNTTDGNNQTTNGSGSDGQNTNGPSADGKNTNGSSADGKNQNQNNNADGQSANNSTENKQDTTTSQDHGSTKADGKNSNGKEADNGRSNTGTATGNEGTGDANKVSDNDNTGNAPTTANTGNSTKPKAATSQDDFVDMGASNNAKDGTTSTDVLAQQILKEYLTGESQVLSPDFIPGAYGSLSSDPQKAETIASEAFGKAVDSVVSDSAVSQAIKDFMAQGNEDLSVLSSFLNGKVTEDQKSQVLSLAKGLNNVTQDGGKSLVSALGNNGSELANSLVLNEVKSQLLSSLPKDQAEMLNSIIGTLDMDGLSSETKQSIVNTIKDLINEALPENSAGSVNDLLQKVVDGKSIDVMDTAKDLGKSITADTLKSVFDKNLDPQLAKKMNALIDAYMENGAQGLSAEALQELNALIDQYAPGADTAKLLKDTVNGIVSGTANPKTWKDVATSVVKDAANTLINESKLPADVKAVAKTAVNGLAENGLTGLTANVRDFISDYVADKLGSEEAGEAVGKIFDAVVTPGVDPWQEIVNQAPVIGVAVAEKVLDEAEKLAAQQIDKLIAKYPSVKKVLDKLGINGAGIVQGFVNVLGVLLSAPSLSDAISQLSTMAGNFLKGIAAKLIDWALEWAVSWLNNTLMPKVLTWASETLGKWADSVSNKLIKKGLEWLKQQCENCKKQGGIKIKTAGTGEKVVNYVEELINKRKKKQGGTTVLQSK